MADPVTVMTQLDDAALSLDKASKQLWKLNTELEPIEERYSAFVEEFEAELFDAYNKGEGKWPGESTRVALAHRAMDDELRLTYRRLTRERKQTEKRIEHITTRVGALRSVLSALKVELEATR